MQNPWLAHRGPGLRLSHLGAPKHCWYSEALGAHPTHPAQWPLKEYMCPFISTRFGEIGSQKGGAGSHMLRNTNIIRFLPEITRNNKLRQCMLSVS